MALFLGLAIGSGYQGSPSLWVLIPHTGIHGYYHASLSLCEVSPLIEVSIGVISAMEASLFLSQWFHTVFTSF